MVKVQDKRSLNLTAEILSNLPLIGEPSWSRLDGTLFSNAIVTNFEINDHTYTSLGLFNVSFVNDTGNYSLTTQNKCGKSSLTVYIDVKGNINPA